MRTRLRRIGSLLLALAIPAVGQNGPSLVGDGYESPYLLKVAPGQIISFRVAGLAVLPADLRYQRANTVPLPTSLAGITVQVAQTLNGSRVVMSAPLLSLEQIPRCADSAAT